MRVQGTDIAFVPGLFHLHGLMINIDDITSNCYTIGSLIKTKMVNREGKRWNIPYTKGVSDIKGHIQKNMMKNIKNSILNNIKKL